MEKILGPARLRAGSRQPEPAERLAADQRAGDPSIQIQVADSELPPGSLQVRRLAGKHAPREFVGRGIGPLQRLLEIAGAKHRQDRAEYLLVSQAMFRADIGKNVGADVRLAHPLFQSGRNLDRQFERPFALADRDVLVDLARGVRVDHRSDVGSGVSRIADGLR